MADLPPPEGDSAMTFLEHLEEFRIMVLRCLAAFLACTALAIPLAPQILHVLSWPLAAVTNDPSQFLRSLRVAGAFTLTLRIAAWGGLLLSAPFLVYFIARFIFPGLHQHERRLAWKAGTMGFLLFAAGTVLAYVYCLPITLQMMLSLHDWLAVSAEWTVNDYVAFSVQLLLGFGLAFELPVVVLILGKLGFVTVEQLRSKRRHAIIVCLVVGMLLTPQDIASMFIMAGPLYFLYEGCILVMRFSPSFRGPSAQEAAP